MTRVKELRDSYPARRVGRISSSIAFNYEIILSRRERKRELSLSAFSINNGPFARSSRTSISAEDVKGNARDSQSESEDTSLSMLRW